MSPPPLPPTPTPPPVIWTLAWLPLQGGAYAVQRSEQVVPSPNPTYINLGFSPELCAEPRLGRTVDFLAQGLHFFKAGKPGNGRAR